MGWYYNPVSGALTQDSGVQAWLQDVGSNIGLSAGWHRLKVPDNASELQAAADAVHEYPKGKPPTTNVPTQLANSAGGVPGISAITGAATNVNTFLSRLTSAALWIRVGEFVLGALLMLSGALKLSGSSADIKDIAKMAVLK